MTDCFKNGSTYIIMDPSIIIILAIIILIIVLIRYLKKPSDKTNTDPGPGKEPSFDPGFSGEPGRPGDPAGAAGGAGGAGNSPAGAGPGPAGSGLLYIPPEMLGGQQQNKVVSDNVESAIVGFDWEAGSGRNAFLYTYTVNKPGWKCPCCEGENENESEICMICGAPRAH